MKIRQHIGSVDIHIDTKRIDNNLREAQRLLANQVWVDCDPFIPFQQGHLKNNVSMGRNGEFIEWNAPYAHYQYEGIVYGPNIPEYDSAGNLIGWWSPPEKYPTDRKIHYHTPGTGDHWFSKAKEAHKSDWIRLVKETVGKE